MLGNLIPSSLNNEHTHRSSKAVSASALYSASVDDLAIDFCFSNSWKPMFFHSIECILLWTSNRHDHPPNLNLKNHEVHVEVQRKWLCQDRLCREDI